MEKREKRREKPGFAAKGRDEAIHLSSLLPGGCQPIIAGESGLFYSTKIRPARRRANRPPLRFTRAGVSRWARPRTRLHLVEADVAHAPPLQPAQDGPPLLAGGARSQALHLELFRPGFRAEPVEPFALGPGDLRAPP